MKKVTMEEIEKLLGKTMIDFVDHEISGDGDGGSMWTHFICTFRYEHFRVKITFGLSEKYIDMSEDEIKELNNEHELDWDNLFDWHNFEYIEVRDEDTEEEYYWEA